VWPFALTGVLLAWDRFVRLRRKPDALPARAGPLLALTALAVASHPTLDWLNNYGLRWLMPFSGEWFYGDALFVIDPWFWLLTGGAAFLTFSRSKLACVRWAVFFGLATWLIFANTELVPLTSAILWVVGAALLVAARWWLRAAPPAMLERAAQAGLAVAAVYIVAMLGSSAAARAEVRATLAARGIEAEDVMVAPAPADPFGGEVIVVTSDEYLTGRFNWLTTPRLRLADERVARPRGAFYELAAQAPEARRYLTWARFPAAEISRSSDGGTSVRIWDVRYADRIFGPTIELAAGAVTLGSD
jgi:inner membrane protein